MATELDNSRLDNIIKVLISSHLLLCHPRRTGFILSSRSDERAGIYPARGKIPFLPNDSSQCKETFCETKQ